MATLIAIALLLAAAVLMTGCTQKQPLTVKLSDHPTYGKILTDSNGRSLYVLAKDIPNTGIVADLGEVARFYPAFYAETVTGERAINIADFGILTRPDGTKQTTYRGWPLYYYLNDKVSGEAKSQGANNITFLAKPDYTVMVMDNESLGVCLSDLAGLALYAREENATAGVTEGYVPFQLPQIIGPSPLVQGTDFSQITGPEGLLQSAYRGKPLYRFSGDRAPGSITGISADYQPVVLAPIGTLSGLGIASTAAPSPTATEATPSTAAVTAVSTKPTTPGATTRSPDDPYTGGKYTPTPFKTIHIVSQVTDTVTPGTWTPIPTGTTTSSVTTIAPIPTATSEQPTQPTTTGTTSNPTSLPTESPTSWPTDTPSTVQTTNPVTTVTTIDTTTVTTIATTVPTIPETTVTTVTTTTEATTIPVPIPITTIPTIPSMPIEMPTGNSTVT
jgi:predicted lipoprotein with Yx(FWY)xxD motif